MAELPHKQTQKRQNRLDTVLSFLDSAEFKPGFGHQLRFVA